MLLYLFFQSDMLAMQDGHLGCPCRSTGSPLGKDLLEPELTGPCSRYKHGGLAAPSDSTPHLFYSFMGSSHSSTNSKSGQRTTSKSADLVAMGKRPLVTVRDESSYGDDAPPPYTPAGAPAVQLHIDESMLLADSTTNRLNTLNIRRSSSSTSNRFQPRTSTHGHRRAASFNAHSTSDLIETAYAPQSRPVAQRGEGTSLNLSALEADLRFLHTSLASRDPSPVPSPSTSRAPSPAPRSKRGSSSGGQTKIATGPAAASSSGRMREGLPHRDWPIA